MHTYICIHISVLGPDASRSDSTLAARLKSKDASAAALRSKFEDAVRSDRPALHSPLLHQLPDGFGTNICSQKGHTSIKGCNNLFLSAHVLPHVATCCHMLSHFVHISP